MQRTNAQWQWVGGPSLVAAALACSCAPLPARSADVAVATRGDDTRLENAGPSDLASEGKRLPTGPERAVPVRVSLPRSGPVLAWLGPSHVAAAVRAQEPAFGACQALGNSESTRREGAITVGWLVGADGSVSDVTIGQSTFASELVNDCVLSVARQITFPASASTAQVFWTVRLRGTESGALAEASRYREQR
jgi:hypothetical protein